MWLDCDLMWVNCSFMSMFRTITYFYVALVMMLILVDVALNEPNAVLLFVWGRSIEKKTLVSIWDLSCLVSLLQVIFSLDPSVTMLFLLGWSVFLPWEKQVYEGSPSPFIFWLVVLCTVGGWVMVEEEWEYDLNEITDF